MLFNIERGEVESVVFVIKTPDEKNKIDWSHIEWQQTLKNENARDYPGHASGSNGRN